MRHVVFAGPSLPADELRALLPDAQLHPPAAVGDVYRALRLKPRSMGLIDGYFDQTLSVHHKEILWAISRGVRVYGGASMGALRAAELHAFGMIGVGRVFEDYAGGALEDDDEVAVIHEADGESYRLRSDAMVNLRATLGAAHQAGAVTESGARALIARLKSLHYSERSYPALEHATAALPPGEREGLLSWLADPSHRVDQKRLDARALVQRMAAEAELPPARPSFKLEHTEAWHELLRQLG